MTGEELRNMLTGYGYVLASVANTLEITPQSLNQRLSSKNMKKDFIDKVELAIGVKPGFLSDQIRQSNVNGDNIHGHSVTVNKTQEDKFLDIIKQQQEQLSKSQEQIDRLLTIIEKLN